MRSRFVPAVVLAVAGALLIGCGGVTDPSKNVTEMFSGTIQTGKSDSAKPFNVSSTGEYTVKITALAPNTSVRVGVDIHQDPSNGNCTGLVLFGRNVATLNVQALSGQIFSGHYCLVAYDVGDITTATTYTITISHP